MPNIFFSGNLKFTVTGSSKTISEVEKAIKKKEAGIVLNYNEKNDPATFEIWPWHIQTGKMEFIKNKKSIVCQFDGIAKVPVAPSAVLWIIKKKTPLFIGGVKGEGWVLEPEPTPLKCPLNLSEKAP